MSVDNEVAEIAALAFFPYTLALALGFTAQTPLWADGDLFSVTLVPRVTPGEDQPESFAASTLRAFWPSTFRISGSPQPRASSSSVIAG